MFLISITEPSVIMFILLRIQAVPEPVDRWQNVSGTGIDMLKLMFDDGKRWSGAFQLCSTLSRLNVALDIDEFKSVRIMERSIYSERYCFLENQLNTGMISSAEFSVMNRWFEFAKKNFRSYVKPDVIGKLLTLPTKISQPVILYSYSLSEVRHRHAGEEHQEARPKRGGQH